MRVAAIATIYHPKSHADVIATKFMKGMSTDEGLMPPEADLVSLYIDHVLENDIGVGLAQEYGVPIYPSIRRALHAGAAKLDVDAVLLIGEHGDYPWNERGRHMYPRRYFFEQIAGVFAESGRSVPVFSDKHLAYDFRDAQWMWDRAEELAIPLMAGSSLPLAWRSPWLEHPKETPIEEALSIGYGGIEAYGYHALETLQCMVERRSGGEQGGGVGAVPRRGRCVARPRRGAVVWRAGRGRLRCHCPKAGWTDGGTCQRAGRFPHGARRRLAHGNVDAQRLCQRLRLCRASRRAGAGHGVLLAERGAVCPFRLSMPQYPAVFQNGSGPVPARTHLADDRGYRRGDEFAPRRAPPRRYALSRHRVPVLRADAAAAAGDAAQRGLHRSAVARHSVGLSVRRAGRRHRENSGRRPLETAWQRGKSTIQQVPFSPRDRPRV